MKMPNLTFKTMGMHIEVLSAENDSSNDWSPGRRKRPAPRRRENTKPSAFLLSQKEKLLALRSVLTSSTTSAARISRESELVVSSTGQHQADAGSDACDRDFVLSLLAHGQNVLFEIDLALQRIEAGTYGLCESSGRAIPRARLEAIPFARFTVEEQAQMEREAKTNRAGRSLQPLFPEDDSLEAAGKISQEEEGDA